MNKFLSFLLLAMVCMFFYSCEKERGAPEACIDAGTAEFKSGKTIRFMNCSKNFDRTYWSVTDEMNNDIFTELTDTLKNFQYSFNTGIFNVNLSVTRADGSAGSSVTERITVTP